MSWVFRASIVDCFGRDYFDIRFDICWCRAFERRSYRGSHNPIYRWQKEDSADADKRNKMTLASSSGFTQREKSAFGISARLRGVSMMVGSTALTRTPTFFSSSARLSVRRSTPALEAA